jgi:hypothetical protein
VDDSPVSDTEPLEDAPEADALEQAQTVGQGERRLAPDAGIEVPEADAIEQAIEVPFDEEEVR